MAKKRRKVGQPRKVKRKFTRKPKTATSTLVKTLVLPVGEAVRVTLPADAVPVVAAQGDVVEIVAMPAEQRRTGSWWTRLFG